MEEFTNVADWIGDHIDQSSEPVRLSTLLAACDKLCVAESTVRLLANNGEFITRDGVVTRGSDTAPVLGNPAEAANLYFRDDDYFSLITVNKDHLRGSSFAVHRSIGARYGLLFFTGGDAFVAARATVPTQYENHECDRLHHPEVVGRGRFHRRRPRVAAFR